MDEPTHIEVIGARAHNLQNVDVSVPRNSLVVFTGVSGSGKSSLAHDTIYKEGQRRFMESLSSYARQFLGQMGRSQVDAVRGISPTLSIDQKTVNRNPRSTVGTVTEIYDHLRLMMARLGTPHCPQCRQPISRVSIDQIVEEVLERGSGKRVIVLAPIVRDRKGEYRQELEGLRRDGWVRVRVDGTILSLEDSITLARYEKHTIEIVVDRLKPSLANRSRLAEAIETAVTLGESNLVVLIDDTPWAFSTERGCPQHPNESIPELEPRTFSFNAPQGACPDCVGLGAISGFEMDRLYDGSQTLPDAVLVFNEQGKMPFAHLTIELMLKLAKQMALPANLPLEQWSKLDLDRLLYGDPSVLYETRRVSDGRVDVRERVWAGIACLVERIWHFTHYKGFERFRKTLQCPACQGTRLNPVARHVWFRDRSISDLCAHSIADLTAWVKTIRLSDEERATGALLLSEISDRLEFLHDVGLGYLSLDRTANTLSGGEAQRIRLAAQVGSGLQGVTYVLDEPSIGLHPRDNARLLKTLFRLRDRGNSVLVVEHDEDTIRSADHVIDVGPGAGRQGGRIVASTTPARMIRGKGLTASYLNGGREIPVPEARRQGSGERLRFEGAYVHNLQDVDVSLPLGTFVVVTGVSGSGKSSLVFGVVETTLRAALNGDGRPVGCTGVEGVEHLDKVIRISQQPIGRTPRSNPATYVGAFDSIRELFSSTPEARARGYKKGRFSFNVKGGRCEACEGAGIKTVEMQYLPPVQVACEVCGGSRFNDETLEIRWKNHSIRDVLNMTVEEASAVFSPVPRLKRIFSTLVDVGLGYIPLGQPSTTLSGGEAQRVKLAKELHRPPTGRTIYLLDEPTTGLHMHDVASLIAALQRLVDAGNTVVVIEHNTDIIKVADYLIDLGPDGGDAGGKLVATGSPESMQKHDSPTGRHLKKVFGEVTVGKSGRGRTARSRTAWTTEGGVLAIRGASRNNLQNIDVDIPHDALTVVTGVSGSGKSSLAFDTIFAEGQRRYVESLSTYARRFLGRLERAPVESLEGLKPAIAIDQRSASRNPRSTVATVTEIHDSLRLLYARVGTPYCPECASVIRGYSPTEVVKDLRASCEGAGWLLAPLQRADQPEDVRRWLLAEGWSRLLLKGEAEEVEQVDLEDSRCLAGLEAGAWLVIDRVRPSRDGRARLAEGVQSAYRMGKGRVVFRSRRDKRSWTWTEHAACTTHGPVFLEAVSPRHFSFNSRLGACPDCQGLGSRRQVVPELLFPRPHQPFWDSMDKRVSSTLQRSPRTRALVEGALGAVGSSVETLPERWTSKQWAGMLDGWGESIALRWERRWGRSVKRVEEQRDWFGIRGILSGWNSPLSWVSAEAQCDTCGGGRLRREVLAVQLGGLGIHSLLGLSIERALAWARALSFVGEKQEVAKQPLMNLIRRLEFLVDTGVGYLALDRAAGSLSGGEAQRIRLASQLGSSLAGVIYVLDEPTIGLHPADTERLLSTLKGLRDNGNTIVVVEHDVETMLAADCLIDLGPGGGQHGGQVIGCGSPEAIQQHPSSLTGRWLSGKERMPSRADRRQASGNMVLHGARTNNLRGENVTIPMGCWTGIAGVSGSGKSSLVMDTLVPAIQAELGKEGAIGEWDALSTGVPIKRAVVVTQAPIGRTPRSTPATVCGVMDPLRRLYASTLGAKERGWGPGRFSFNGSKGRCSVCEGRGVLLIEMHFLPDVWTTCSACKGRRYNRETLEIRWKGHTIADVLTMRVEEALALFSNHRRLAKPLQALVDVGLGYLALGQPATTLSGGEAQRVKLASELTSRRGHCVYVLDEPTTGLHLDDVRRLIDVLHALVDAGHTVVTIEHQVDLLQQVDHLIELGPGGGEEGGHVIATGTPEEVQKAATPTGMALASSHISLI